MLNVVTFKWQQQKNEKVSIPSQLMMNFNSEHVNIFYDMIDRNLKIPHRNVCVTDDPIGLDKSIERIELWDKCRSLGGCYNRLYVFSEDMKYLIGDRLLCCDLDMVIVDDITPIITKFDNNDFVYYKMRGPNGTGSRMNNSMFMMNAGARSFVWERFNNDTEAAINAAKSTGPGTDQAWCNYILDLNYEAHWSMDDCIYDMRLDFVEPQRINLINDARIVMFPGPRSPCMKDFQDKYPWIKQHYRRT